METVWLIVIVGFLATVFGAVLFFSLRARQRGERQYEGQQAWDMAQSPPGPRPEEGIGPGHHH